MRWIYLSPHLDDAVLSAGGWIYEQTRRGLPVEIWTIMCGIPQGEISPFAQVIHYQWGISEPEEVVRLRKLEDAQAAQLVGAKTLYFDFLDCIYRRGKHGGWLYADIFSPPHEDEASLPAQIASVIAARLQPEDKVICQFAIGPHVDHVLVRQAAELLHRPLLYALDVPYIFRAPEQIPAYTEGLRVANFEIGVEALRIWQDGIAAYASQISSLFENENDMREKIAAYAGENRNFSLWLRV